ncbi:MAG: autotransporter-associated beta strand repeat-containing protein, partial [Verrucomicrobiota bacterium]
MIALISLGIASARLAAADKTWSGAGTDVNWNTGPNWGGGVPVGGDNLIFGALTRRTNNNNIAANTAFGWLTFNTGPFALGGNVFYLTNSITNSAGANLISNTISFATPSAAGQFQATQILWNAAASGNGALVLKGFLTNSAPTGTASGTNVLLFGGSGDFGVSNVISGVAGLIKTGAGNLTLGATNTYGGNTTVGATVDTLLLGGMIRAGANYVIPGVGAGRGNLNISNATTFDLNGTMQALNGLNGDATASVDNYSANPAVLGIGSNSFWGGNIQDTHGGNVTVSNYGGGATFFTAANTYHGQTKISGGMLILTNTATILNSPVIYVNSGKLFRIDNTEANNVANRIADTATMILDQGNFFFEDQNTGASGTTFSETIGTLIVTNRDNRIDVQAAAPGQTNILTFANVLRYNGATLNVTGGGLGRTNQTYTTRLIFTDPSGLTNVGSVLGIVPWMRDNGDNFVRYNPNVNSPQTMTGTQDYWLNAPETAWNNNTNLVLLRYGQTLTADRPVGALNLAYSPAQAGSAVGPLNLGGNTLRIASGSLLMSSRDFGGQWLITNGTLIAGVTPGTPAELIAYTRNNNFSQFGQVGLATPLAFTGNEIAATIADNSGGAVQLTKAIGYTLILSGNNTYSGGTTIQSGGDTLILGNGGTSGNAGYGNITNFSNLAFNRTDDYTFTNIIRASGAVAKYNTNSITFTSDSPYSGALSVYNGATILAGLSGRFSGAAYYNVFRGSLVISNATGANHGDRLKDSANVALYGGAMVFTNDGSNQNFTETVNFQTAMGSSKVIAGPAQVGYKSVLTLNAPNRQGYNPTLNIVGPGLGTNVIASGGATNLVVFSGGTTLQNGTFNPAYIISGTEFAKYATNSSLNVTSAMPMIDLDYALNALEAVWVGTTNVKWTAGGAITLSGSRSVNTLNLAQTAGTTLDLSAGSLTVSNSGILASGDYPASITGGTLNAGVAELIFHVMIPTNSGNALTVSSAITNQQNSGTALVLTKSGQGKLVLSGNNLFNGNTVLNEGVLSVGTISDTSPSPMGTNVGTTIYLRGGTFQFTGDNSATPTARKFEVNNNIGGGINVTAGNNLVLTNAFVGSVGFSELLKTGQGKLTLGGTVDNVNLKVHVKEGKLVLNKSAGGSGYRAVYGITGVSPGATIEYGNTAYGDQIYDSGNFVVLNMNGLFDFKGASDGFNNMTGTGLVTNSAVGTTTYMTNGANGSGSMTTVNIGDGIGFGGGTVALVKGGGGNSLVLTGNNAYHGRTYINSGVLMIDSDTRLGTPPSSFTPDQLILNGGSLGGIGGTVGIHTNRGITLATDSGIEVAMGTTLCVTSAITGNFTLTKNTEGTLVLLNPANNWTNGLTISGGIVQLGANEVIPNGTGLGNVTINASGAGGIAPSAYQLAGTLDLNGFNETINGLTVNNGPNSGKVLNNAPNTINTLTVGDGDGGSTISGGLYDNNNNLGGVLVLRKIGTNNLFLTNTTNYHSGGFIFENGRTDFVDDYSLGAVPATPTTNLVFNGGVIFNNRAIAAQIATNRTINLLAGGGYFMAGYTPGTLTINGRITGVGALNFGFENSTNILTNPGNDYAGKTIVGNNVPNTSHSGLAPKLKLGASEVIPNGPGKGLLLLTNGSLVDMAGFTETVNGLGAWGSAVAGTIDNSIGNANLIVGDAGTTSSFNGVLKNTFGTLSLTKIGAGKLTLTGVNTYSGGTTNAGGTLNINDDTALGAAAPLVFAGSSTLQEAGNLAFLATRPLIINNGVTATNDDQGFSITINSIISGPGNLTKAGAGTLSLYGANTYSGNTLVTDGTLLITSAHQGGGGFQVNDGKTLTIGFSGPGQTVPMSSLTLGSGATLNFTGWATDPANPSVWATNLVVNGTGTINISGQFVAGVTIPLIRYTGAIGGSGFAGLRLGTLPDGTSAALQDNAGEVDLVITSTPGTHGSYPITWTGVNNGNWDVNTTTNWVDYSAFATTYLQSTEIGDVVRFDDSASAFTVNLTTNLAPASVTISNNSQNYLFTGSGRITGTTALIKHGAGSVTLGNSNTFTGGTIFTNGGGKIVIDANNALSAGAMINFGSSGTLDLNGNSQVISNLTFTTATMTNVPALTNNFTATVVGVAGSTLIYNGTADLNVGPNVMANTLARITNTLDMSGLGNFVFTGFGNTNTLRVGGYVSGWGNQCGVITLAASNTIAALAVGVGDFTFNAPQNYTNAIHLGQANSLSLGSLNVGSTRQAHALMDFATTWTSPTLTLRGTNGPSSGVPNVWVGSQSHYGNDNLYHVLDLSAGSVDAVIDTLTIGRMEGRFGTENGLFAMNAGNMTVTNIMLGQNVVILTGTAGFATNSVANGTLTLSGGTINAGTVTLSDTVSNVLSASGTFVLTNSGSLLVKSITRGRIVGTNVATVTLNGTNAVLDLLGGAIGTNGIAATYVPNLNFQAGTLKNVAEINGGTNLVKTGTGILTLAGTNAYSGATVVSNGTLLVQGIIDTNLVTVWGGTLGGNGQIKGTVSIQSNGTLSPGSNGVGVLAVNNNVRLGGATVMEISKVGSMLTNDLVTGINTLTNGGTLNVVLAADSDPVINFAAGDTWQLFSAAFYTATFTVTNLPALSNGLVWDTSALNTHGTIRVVGVAAGGIIVTPSPTNTVEVGSPVGFLATASGTPPITYYWYANSNFATPVVVTNVYTNASAACGDDHTCFNVVASNTYGVAISAPVYVAVTDSKQPAFVMDLMPGTNTTGIGSNFTLSVSMASNCHSPVFTWFFNATNVLVQNNTNTLVLTNLQMTDSGKYLVMVTNINGATNSAEVTLVVTNHIIPPFNLSISPAPTNTVEVGNTAGFLAAASGTSPDYRWYLNSNFATVVFSGAAFTNPVAQCANRGDYYNATASNENGVAISAPVYVMVTDSKQPAFVTDLMPGTN